MSEVERVNLFSHREIAAWGKKKKRLPVTLVTGFLGSGKTTLLRYILSNKENLRIAAAVNDFASINIDADLVSRNSNDKKQEVVALTNGCMCCSIAQDLRQAVWRLLQECDLGNIDYLVIETSGISDPLASIRALEEDYGKMYRVRLDSVVTVVDSDFFLGKLQQVEESGEELPVAAASQLKYADVVLLNKKDLLSSEDMNKLEKGIRQYALPGVSVYRSKHCAVPLDAILEVSQSAAGPQLVSHEFVRPAYSVPEAVGRMRTVASRENASLGKPAGHLGADKFMSVVFESERPLRLAAFQDFLASNLVTRVSRMKGGVFFAELPHRQFMFHWSGRQRYELSEEAVIGESRVQLVVLGQDLSDTDICTSLQMACSTSQSEISEGSWRHAKDVVRSNDLFDLVEIADMPANLIVFQLNGCKQFGISKEEASTLHAVNFDKLNLALQEAVNCASGPAILASVRIPNGSMAVCHALGSTVQLTDIWPTVSSQAEQLVDVFFFHVRACRCGW